MDGALYLTATTQTEGTELRQLAPDGTLSTVKDILPGSEGSSPSNLTVDGGRLLFSADDGVHGDEIWQLSDPGPDTAVPSGWHVRPTRPRDRAWSS